MGLPPLHGETTPRGMAPGGRATTRDADRVARDRRRAHTSACAPYAAWTTAPEQQVSTAAEVQVFVQGQPAIWVDAAGRREGTQRCMCVVMDGVPGRRPRTGRKGVGRCPRARRSSPRGRLRRYPVWWLRWLP